MDVDGVLNIFPKSNRYTVERGEASPFISDDDYAGTTFPITWRPDITKRIMDMHDRGIVKVVWLTTWGYGANYGLHSLIGFHRLDVIADPEHVPYRNMGFQNWWKALAVRTYLEENNPKKIVWTDDDLGYHKNSVADIYDRVDALMISPNERHGLTAHDLDAIEKFLTASDVQTDDDGI